MTLETPAAAPAHHDAHHDDAGRRWTEPVRFSLLCQAMRKEVRMDTLINRLDSRDTDFTARL
ncbi:hypothetical protein, partial [Pseudoalteromonas sp. S4492]|uniref:hypothetical protein n=1 Tax=Pseudoalteromonas sp. S4492 TaxID=579560 RepID=UPI001BB1C2D7